VVLRGALQAAMQALRLLLGTGRPSGIACSPRRPCITRSAPIAPSRSANARPRPRPAPVTSATLPARGLPSAIWRRAPLNCGGLREASRARRDDVPPRRPAAAARGSNAWQSLCPAAVVDGDRVVAVVVFTLYERVLTARPSAAPSQPCPPLLPRLRKKTYREGLLETAMSRCCVSRSEEM